MFDNIHSPRYINASKTMVAFSITSPNGGPDQTGQYTIPGPEEGLNKFHEHIKANYDMDELADILDKAVEWEKSQHEIQSLKDEGNREAIVLGRLFNLKAEAFKLPWIDSAPPETKMALRRSPNETILNTIISIELIKYMEASSESYSDVLDKVDAQMYGE